MKLPEFSTVRASTKHLELWVKMRLDLWPNHSREDHEAEALSFLETPSKTPVFLCLNDLGQVIGFLEGNIRESAEGCHTNRVGYVEGWFVIESERGKGAGGVLMHAFFSWCGEMGITEAASDTWEWNEQSIKAHQALGFSETEKIIHFRKNLLQ
ncbi:MAG TPA: GNAT family N-acetyltransferase [Anaerolineales bacterium]|nr:GNAT family N-acetyltransferase [Anaerolineales bacterium]